ncbi:hypothetical protein [Jeotgalibacillus soli]|uniref:Uncharacterized protein n=1 Tax=Jeotgalibacillus soli TaxID=889306 RepID=A0A0C2W023_9BACL|nr:hypothetical protein [Jeotgalibacillus soli]KIL49971.1 hypothetical protein KP78_14390 [Jeotgalibacillus soli]
MDDLIKRTTWFILGTAGAVFLGIGILFSLLGMYVLGVDMITVFKWVLVIFLLGTGIIGSLIFIGALGFGLKTRFSSGKTA